METAAEALQAGLAAHRAGRLLEAEHMYQLALRTQPRHAGALHLLGLLAFQVGKHDQAEQLVHDAIKIDGFSAIFWADLGEVHRAQGKIASAIAAYRKAITLNPELVNEHNQLGTLLQLQGNVPEAIASYRQALELDPQHAETHSNLAVALESQGQLAEAQAAHEQSVRLNPDRAEAYLRLGRCLHQQGQLLEAIACYQKAMRLQPDLAEAHYCLGIARLTSGDLAAGWREYPWRFRSAEFSGPPAPFPFWNGANLNGRRILVYADSGLGETLQLIRYVPRVEQRGGEVVLQVNPSLTALLEQSGFKQVNQPSTESSACEVCAPLSALPMILGTTLDSIPAEVPYLMADPELSQRWEGKLRAYSGFKVGIHWQADAAAQDDRSIPLAEFEPLAQVPNVHLVSLQKEFGPEQQAVVGDRFTIGQLPGPMDEGSGAFLDTAAIMKNLDLVITANSAIAHLAGALGVRVWVALPYATEWYWFLNRDDSPWYPTMRLFRQTRLGEWPDVFRRMADELPLEIRRKVV